MYDSYVILGIVGADYSHSSQKQKMVRFYGKRLPKKLKTFNAAGDQNWQYFIMLVSDNPVNQPAIYIESRLTFTDV